ncbi:MULTISPECIES: class I ribonucleotide reductase maintenance protein YfaE [Alteromonas]|uniref:class I ribonucleotide reductase maintenance protein YfaE n=1 Tax=Alteromonas sp. MmMcT2-5 TaxID=2917733 RepID=UPI0009C10770|nr:class I ribonucleotide reductase maintenance protein YfaE [Alteromonas macleodii]MCG7649935.1 class I ribonucleotide reductase maintenance protein YfaE [Alteromonas sp. MmMcT2-5]
MKKIICKTEFGTIDVPDSGDTILKSLLAINIDIQYHCKEGFCGACRCPLGTGSVEYIIDPLAFIHDEEFLPCCSKPLTDIVIDLTR